MITWASRMESPPGSGTPVPMQYDGIEPVDVEGDVGRAGAADAPAFPDHLLPAHLLEVVHRDDAHADVIAVLDVVVAEAGAAQADLDRALGIEDALLHQAAGTAWRG